ncbi:MAG: hypothetical protein ABIS06_15860 [Vicinamibacterales bacterium]
MGFLEFHPAGGDPESSSHHAADGAADTTGVLVGENNPWGQDEIRGLHLAAANIRGVLQFAAPGQVTFLLHLRQAGSSFDHEEAVRVLDQDAEHRGGRAKVVAAQGANRIRFRFVDRDRPDRRTSRRRPSSGHPARMPVWTVLPR